MPAFSVCVRVCACSVWSPTRAKPALSCVVSFSIQIYIYTRRFRHFWVLSLSLSLSLSLFLCFGWMRDMEKWFRRWDATHLLHDASLDSSVNEAFLQRQYIMSWDKCGGSRFTHYTTHVAPNYKISIFFAERGNRTHRYMLEPIPLSAIRTIASM